MMLYTPVLVLGLLGSQEARAPFAIDLTVRVGEASKTAHAAQPTPGFTPGRKPVPRSVLQAKSGERVSVRWSVTRNTGTPAVKNVLVHFFVAPLEKAGQGAVPKGDKNNPVESAIVMDFKAGLKAQGDLSFTINQPGVYLLRLETIGASETDGRESFAALDLVLR